MKRYGDRIERLYMVDLEVAILMDEPIANACDELSVGLLVQHSVLIPRKASGDTNDVVRFTGPRNQLEELLNRYDGVVGSFDPSPFNPDPQPVIPL